MAYKFLKTKRFYSSAQSKTFISENHTYDLDVSNNLVVGFDFFTTLGFEFGHQIGTTWSSETLIGSVVT